MVHGGVGLARLQGGRIVLVKGAIPGEAVRVDVSESGGVLRGELQEVVEPSPDRLPPPLHPGLDYGHVRYPRQLDLKHEVVLDALGRALRKEPPRVAPVVASPRIWRYRSVVQPAVTTSKRLGYRLPGSQTVVAMNDDPVANETISQVWRMLSDGAIPKGVREIAIRANDRGESLIALIASSPQRSLLPFSHGLVEAESVSGVSYAKFDSRGRFRGGSERLAGDRQIRQRYGRLELSVTVSSFAQPNPEAADGLYTRIGSLVEGGRGMLELFAGSGAIALQLADRFESVDAVEIDRASVARGRADAERMGIANVRFHAGDVRDFEIDAHVDLLVVDPPRSGLSKEVRANLTASAGGRLLYVSCDPATWARDVAHFVSEGWSLDLAEPFDFYPHTHHVELLSLLSR